MEAARKFLHTARREAGSVAAMDLPEENHLKNGIAGVSACKVQ
jgi:hypothetical protein